MLKYQRYKLRQNSYPGAADGKFVLLCVNIKHFTQNFTFIRSLHHLSENNALFACVISTDLFYFFDNIFQDKH